MWLPVEIKALSNKTNTSSKVNIVITAAVNSNTILKGNSVMRLIDVNEENPKGGSKDKLNTHKLYKVHCER